MRREKNGYLVKNVTYLYKKIYLHPGYAKYYHAYTHCVHKSIANTLSTHSLN